MPKITMIRPEKWLNRAKDITVFIDDKEVGNVDEQNDLRYDVSPGKHIVLIKNKWGAESNPLEVDLSDNEDKVIMMSNSKYLFMAFLIVASIATFIYSHLRGYFDIDPNSLHDIIFMIGMYLLIFALFFRKNFLKLKEVGVSKESKEEEKAKLLRKILAVEKKDVLYDV